MPKTKQAKNRNKFNYTKDRKKLKRSFIKKSKPRIEDSQIRHAWDDNKSVAKNLQEMGLSFDPNRSVPIQETLLGENKDVKAPEHIVTKPYVLKKLQEEASRPQKDTKTLSSDLIEFVQHMVREHKDDFKAMAQDEKNYYQDTPKQIRRKLREYQRCHPQQYEAFMSSLAAPEPTVQ
ncbi:nucleolar protein 16 [Nematolebias whitei]|uniref:nucleolar protein 16 n=1 Tax=Nematolebias whitei TaxID=451745 RepID=UPI00189C0F75|nr:nucleolar protein 16 [Nematolebias whitei]